MQKYVRMSLEYASCKRYNDNNTVKKGECPNELSQGFYLGHSDCFFSD